MARVYLTVFALLLSLLSLAIQAKDLKASLALLPIHSEKGPDGKPRGGFVDIVKALDSLYPNGQISIKQQPFLRSIKMVEHGQADFHIPSIKPNHIDAKTLTFSYADECITKVPFVLYSRVDRPNLSRDSLDQYKIDTLRGHKDLIPFPVKETNTIELGMKKLLANRIDGFIMEQEAVDQYIISNKIKNIRRELFAEWDSCIIIPKGNRGEKINHILSDLMRQLRTSGELEKINKTIHKPYNNWQPINYNYE